MRDCSHVRDGPKVINGIQSSNWSARGHAQETAVDTFAHKVRKQVYSELMPLTALNFDDSRNRSW
jgi:hypothetical protein